ncbi:hypothetical protein [Heyndrickxia acidiproducens]|uniref:hypothetical protein n=1 Tax=Heyndrickxia acidiproducens TaxID=1121084 RepID=UPI00036640F5|nr:hypothetical protein [Heyndrickxia acidiproducens]
MIVTALISILFMLALTGLVVFLVVYVIKRNNRLKRIENQLSRLNEKIDRINYS